MEKTSQLLLRNAGNLASGSTLLVNPGRDHCFRDIASAERPVQIFTQDYGDYRWFLDNGATAEFGIAPSATALYQQIVLIQPREKARLEMMLHACAPLVRDGGCLWLVGEIRTGIKSAGKRVQKYFSRVSKVDNARHCSLFQSTGALPLEPFKLDDYEEHWQATALGAQLPLVSLPGSFAHGRLDKGTQVLLGLLEEFEPAGAVLDFGCGSGVVGLALLKRNPEIDLTLLDTSALALESARRSMQANGLEAVVLPSDGLQQATGPYDWIISNPPFHKGVGTDLTIVRRFFADSGRILTKRGKMLLVCNRHLPYEAWLEEQFAKVSCVHSGREFKVVLVQRPRQ